MTDLEILQLIIDDCAKDVEEYDGKPFTGKTVGELHGILEAKVEALARILKRHIAEEGGQVKFNLAITTEKSQAWSYFTTLANKKALVEVKKISPKRSLSQNNYLHLLIGAFGQHFGYTMEEAKSIYKRLSPEIYQYKKNSFTFWRSSADLTKEEMAITIDKFMDRSKEAGYPLPLATDQGWLREIENEIERSKYYMRST